MECLVENGLDAHEVHLNNRHISSLTRELQSSPLLEKLFLQQNNNLTTLPPSLFQQIPVLQVLNLSRTSIQSLPPSIFKLRLLKEFVLQECSLLVEVPPEIGALKNLKLFDLEGTEIMYLPKEIGNLQNLERLRVSLSAYADDHKDRYCIEHIIPRMTISKLTKLKELSISVDPEAEWWELELLEAIMGDLLFLTDLKTLKLYLPTDKALQRFLSLERDQVPIYSSLWNYRFLTGHCEQLPFSVQLETEENFLKLEKCVKNMNGEGYTDEIGELIRNARSLYLRRHWTIDHLPVSDMRKMKYCLLMECNEMKTVVNQDKDTNTSEDKNKDTNTSEDEVLGSLQYLAVHFMKKLQSILKGPISKNSLSCLRILALHSCPELTSIFTESLLVNMKSLAEVIVEDCPKVSCLVNLEEGTPWAPGPFLSNLKRISLLDLPELVSISGGFCIAPQLDTLIVFNCMRLDYLSVMELPKGTKAIKGETEWWNALKYGKLMWESVFVQLKRDRVLMDQLAKDTNSLQHFLKLKVVPSFPGISQKVNNNSSRNTKEDWEHVKVIQPEKKGPHIGCQVPSDGAYIWRKYFQNESLNHKYYGDISSTTSKHKVKVNKGVEVDKALNDGYTLRKYGEKSVAGAKSHRSYYRRSFSRAHGCGCKKSVQRSREDPSISKVMCKGKHTCPPVLSNYCFSTETESACRSLRIQDLSAETESASTVTDIHLELAKRPQVLEFNKKKSTSASNTDWTQKVKLSSKTGSDMPPDDGYIWRKYGQKEIPEAKISRSYFKCTSCGCGARKHVQRSVDDPSIWEITYNGMHTCLRLSVTSNSANETESAFGIINASDFLTVTESAFSIVNSSDFSTATGSELRILKTSDSSSTGESTSILTDNSFGLDSMRKMSGSASIRRWKQQTKDISSSFSPSLKLKLPSSSITSEPNIIISKIEENSSSCIPSSTETPQNAEQHPSPKLKAYQLKTRKEKLGDRISGLHQLVSPFGKTDTGSVLLETCEHIRFLHKQVNVLMAPHTKQGTPFDPKQQTQKHDLRSQGLCLVPVSTTVPITNKIATKFWNPAFEEPPES